jgi:hypothetical protein
MWDELGWSEARKAKERQYLDAEALDPAVQQILSKVDSGAGSSGTGV